MRTHPAIVMMPPPYPTTTASTPNWSSTSSPYNDYLTHGSGQRVQTAAPEIRAIRAKHPDRHLTIVSGISFGVPPADLLSFATAGGEAKATLSTDFASETVIEHGFAPPARRHGGGEGTAVHDVKFAVYDYEYQGATFLLYVVYASEGYMTYRAQFLLSEPGSKSVVGGAGEASDEQADALIEAATTWGQASHEEAWVFDRGFWQKDKELYKSIQGSSWDDVILDAEKKKAMIDDVEGFFSSEESYKEFSVPWKRGLIFYGPPGNGKTISIKALMHTLSQRSNPSVDMLYVKTFNTFAGPEQGILSIFLKARQMAPCMLIFEDIDSLVNPSVRSYFLNAVDGLESNHGILMIGSTNHLERLDPGIAKRPSRFDRKYLFALPVRAEREQYARYWQGKLSDNKKIAFPDVLCGMIADITDDFSFAYMKEAFVAALLVIVAKRKDDDDEEGEEEEEQEEVTAASIPVICQHQSALFSSNIVIDDRVVFISRRRGGDDDDNPDGRKQAEKTKLWKEIKKQVKILRDEMESDAVKEQIKLSIAAPVVNFERGLHQMSTEPSRF